MTQEQFEAAKEYANRIKQVQEKLDKLDNDVSYIDINCKSDTKVSSLRVPYIGDDKTTPWLDSEVIDAYNILTIAFKDNIQMVLERRLKKLQTEFEAI